MSIWVQTFLKNMLNSHQKHVKNTKKLHFATYLYEFKRFWKNMRNSHQKHVKNTKKLHFATYLYEFKRFWKMSAIHIKNSLKTPKSSILRHLHMIELALFWKFRTVCGGSGPSVRRRTSHLKTSRPKRNRPRNSRRRLGQTAAKGSPETSTRGRGALRARSMSDNEHELCRNRTFTETPLNPLVAVKQNEKRELFKALHQLAAWWLSTKNQL